MTRDQWARLSVLLVVATSTLAVQLRYGVIVPSTDHIKPAVWLVLPCLAIALLTLHPSLYPERLAGLMLLAFTGWTALSVLWSPAPARTLAFAWFFVIVYLTYRVVASAIVTDVVDRREVVLVLLMVVAGHMLVGLKQLIAQQIFTGHPTVEIVAGIRAGLYVVGYAGGAYAFATMLVLITPLLLRGQHATAHLRATGMLVAAGLVRVTTGDAARGGFLVAIWTAAVLAFQHLSRSHFLLLMVASSLILMPGIVPTETTTPSTNPNDEHTPSDSVNDPTTPPGPVENTVENGRLFDTSGLSPRLRQYDAALPSAIAHPITGVGAGVYAARAGTPIHNWVLLLLVNTGAVGLLTYAVAVLGGLKDVWKNPRVVGGIIGVLAIGLFDHLVIDRLPVLLAFWILIAVYSTSNKTRSRKNKSNCSSSLNFHRVKRHIHNLFFL